MKDEIVTQRLEVLQRHAAEAQESPNTDRIEQYLRLKYPMEIIEDDDGVVASIPDLPGCASFGDSVEAAVRNLHETKALWIKGRIDGGQTVPEPSLIEDFSGKFVLRIPRSLHRSLDREAKKQGVSLNQYVLHLLSERHAMTKIENVLEQSEPSFANHCYMHAKDAWTAKGTIYRFSMSAHSAKAFESPDSLLGMLDFLPKPKGFRKILPVQKQLRTAYER
jgi:antitoxin HicB